MGKEGRWMKGTIHDADQLNGLLDKGCQFEGKLHFSGVVQINGEFRGEIVSKGTLMVGPDAHLNAKVHVDTLIVDGCIEGEVIASNKIELHASGRLIADIMTKGLVIEEGGMFHGLCQATELQQPKEIEVSGHLFVAKESAVLI